MHERLAAFLAVTAVLAACDPDGDPGADPRDHAADLAGLDLADPADSADLLGPEALQSSDDPPIAEGLLSCLLCGLLGGHDPVCAGDGVTYANACLADCHGDHIWHPGPCQCGNGIQTPGEACDDGTNNGPDRPCRADCRVNVCGDGQKSLAEQCDDGNLVGGDGCSALCNLEVCGNNIVDPGEDCDEGGDVPGCVQCTYPVDP